MGIYTLKQIRYLSDSLTFWAPFNDPDNPLLVRRGGPLTMVRATTATYLHPVTGLITEAANNILRIEANGALIEGQRTNLYPYSRKFDEWAFGGGTFDLAQDQVGIDGAANTAWTLDDTDESADMFIYQYLVVDDDNADYAGSVFIAKDNDETRFPAVQIWLRDGSDGGRVGVTINTKTGAFYEYTSVGTVSSVVEDFNDDWWRVKLTVQNNSTGNVRIRMILTPCYSATLEGANDTSLTGSIVIDGAQLEVGTFPSSYIPTTDSAVTRNADVLTFAESGNIGLTEGTVVMQYDQPQIVLAAYKLYGATGSRYLYSITTKDLIYDGTGGNQFDGSEIVASVIRRAATAWSAGTSLKRITADGGEVETDAFDDLMQTATDITIGSQAGSFYIFGHIKNLKIYGVALSDTQMIGKTS